MDFPPVESMLVLDAMLAPVPQPKQQMDDERLNLMERRPLAKDTPPKKQVLSDVQPFHWECK